MNVTDNYQKESYHPSRVLIPDREHGLCHSLTVAKAPREIYEFCQDPGNVEKVLKDLPMDIDNFLNLKLDSSSEVAPNQYQIKWINKPNSEFAGTLTFMFKKAPANRGTLLTAIAEFKDFSARDGGPSDLILIFLKRMKSLIETGEIATTKGQPSGRDEIQNQNQNNLH